MKIVVAYPNRLGYCVGMINNTMKTVEFKTFKLSDGKRLTAMTADILVERGFIIVGGESEMIASGHRRHNGMVKSNPLDFQTLAPDDAIRDAAELAIKKDTHVLRKMLRGDTILGRCEISTGTASFKLGEDGKLSAI